MKVISTIENDVKGFGHEPKEHFKGLIGVFDKYTSFKKFLRTKSRISKGDNLYDLSKEQLDEKKVMSPWTFNIYETILIGIVANLIAKTFAFFAPEQVKKVEIGADLTIPVSQIAKETATLIPSINNFLSPFLFPTVLSLTVFIVGYASLQKKHSTFKNRQRVRNAYLYFDGASGLFPQLIFSILLSLILVIPWEEEPSKISENQQILAFSMLGLMIGTFITEIFILRRIKYRIFALMGYEKKTKDPDKKMPKNRYRLFAFTGNLLVVLFFWGYAWLVKGIAYIMAAIKVWVVSLY